MEPKRKKRKLAAASLANLKPIKKGMILNPLGAGAHDPHKKLLKKITNETVKEVIEAGLTGTFDALEKIMNDKEESALKRGLAKAALNASKSGDAIMLERLFERLTGKVPIQINATVQPKLPKTEAELLAELENVDSSIKQIGTA